MAMTRKHYRNAAEMLHRAKKTRLHSAEEALAYVQGWLEAEFEEDNPRFDTERFRKWIKEGTDQ